MLNYNSINITANSVIDGEVAVYFSASMPDKGNATISKIIANKDLYLANKDECEADYSLFEEQAMNYSTEV